MGGKITALCYDLRDKLQIIVGAGELGMFAVAVRAAKEAHGVLVAVELELAQLSKQQVEDAIQREREVRWLLENSNAFEKGGKAEKT